MCECLLGMLGLVGILLGYDWMYDEKRIADLICWFPCGLSKFFGLLRSSLHDYCQIATLPISKSDHAAIKPIIDDEDENIAKPICVSAPRD